MRPRSLDAELDKLYQLPLDEFTAARNALAREAGVNAADVRALQKPPLAAWAVNQLYWKNRSAYDALIEAAMKLRSAHKAVVGGRGGDLRAASQAHDEALDRALKATLDRMKDSGQKATEATRQSVLNILRALPAADPPGRLARALQPGGLEMLTGFDIAGGEQATLLRRAPTPAAKKAGRADKATSEAARKAAVQRRTEAREAVADAARVEREAETELRRREFAAARASKEAEKATSRLEQAREAVAAAEREVEDAERAVTAANKARDRAHREAEESQGAVDAARDRLERAQQALAAADE